MEYNVLNDQIFFSGFCICNKDTKDGSQILIFEINLNYYHKDAQN